MTDSTIHNKYKSIRIDLSEEEHRHISRKAAEMKYSLRSYSKLRVLDDTTGMEERRRKIFQLMPHFYNLVDEIEDSNTRQALKEIGGKICLFLK